jgi:hypothetical protein
VSTPYTGLEVSHAAPTEPEPAVREATAALLAAEAEAAALAPRRPAEPAGMARTGERAVILSW